MPKTLLLSVPLSPEEHLKLALEMSKVIREAEAKEEEKKNVNAALTAEVNALWSRIHDLNGPVASGRVDRDVEVEERIFVERKEVEIWRVDTVPPTLYKTRPLDPDERQLTNGLDREATKKQKAEATEEQQADTPEEAEERRTARIAAEHLERAQAQVAAVEGKFLVLETGRTDGDTFRASIGVEPGCPWTEILEALGGSAVEAIDALKAKCVGLLIAASGAAVKARFDRILARLGELYTTATVFVDASGVFFAKVETDDSVMEATGSTEDDARANLRAKILRHIEAKEDEPVVVETGNGAPAPKTLLKAPKKTKASKAKEGGVETTVKVGETEYHVIVRADSDGTFSARCAEFPALMAITAPTVEEACASMASAIEAMLGNQPPASNGEGPEMPF